MIAATLIYNTGAGSSSAATPDDLILALHAAGYEAHYRPTQDEAELDEVLHEISGPVFVAGGDGTVRGVAIRLAGKPGVQLGILPMGTSNNIGATLELNGSPLELIARYAGAPAQPFDVGRVAAPWGHDLFIEAFGCGVFADVLAAYDPAAPKSPVRGLQAGLSTLPGYQPLPLALDIDQQVFPETPLLILEVMNIKATGNGMKLGTSADPGDGLLNVVRVDGEHRDGLLAYLSALARDDFEALPSVMADEARQVRIPYIGQDFHVDGEVRSPKSDPPSSLPAASLPADQWVTVEVWPGALQVLRPTPPGSADTPSGSADTLPFV